MVAPGVVEAQHRDAPLVDHVRIDLAVAVLARHLLAAAGEVDERAVVAAVLVLEVGAVAAAAALRVVLDAAAEAVAGHAEAAAELDVVAAREAERLVVAPPRDVEVHAADAVGVVARRVHQRRDEAADAEPGRVGQVLADHAARVGEAVREARRLRVEQQARRLAAARREHDDRARAPGARCSVVGVDVGHAGRQAVGAGHHLARHRVRRRSSACRSSAPAAASPTRSRSSSASRSRGRTGRSSGRRRGR